jgi:isoleucyl-tRNA synthetase
MRYTDIWNYLTQKICYWVDLEDLLLLTKTKYMESIWWLLKEIYNKKYSMIKRVKFFEFAILRGFVNF